MEGTVMFRKTMVVLFVLALGASACQEVDIAAEEEAIKAVLKKQTDSFYNKSLEGEFEVWAHEPYVFRGFSIDHVIGWENLKNLYEDVFASDTNVPYLSEHSRHFIHIKDDVAWTVYHQVLHFENEQGFTEKVEGWELRILEKMDGDWRIVLQMNAPYPPEDQDVVPEENPDIEQ